MSVHWQRDDGGMTEGKGGGADKWSGKEKGAAPVLQLPSPNSPPGWPRQLARPSLCWPGGVWGGGATGAAAGQEPAGPPLPLPLRWVPLYQRVL